MYIECVTDLINSLVEDRMECLQVLHINYNDGSSICNMLRSYIQEIQMKADSTRIDEPLWDLVDTFMYWFSLKVVCLIFKKLSYGLGIYRSQMDYSILSCLKNPHLFRLQLYNIIEWYIFYFYIYLSSVSITKCSQTCLMWPSKRTLKLGHIRLV
jgi:hypothetical protein